MAVINISENKANQIVKKSLIELGFSDDLEIKSYIGDDDKVKYNIYSTTIYKGEIKKLISKMNFFEYKDLLKRSLENNGDIYNIGIEVHGDKIEYVISSRFYGKTTTRNQKVFKRGRYHG